MAVALPKPWVVDTPALRRTREVARVLSHHGLGALVDQAGLRPFSPLRAPSRGAGAPSQPERVRLALGELGATFIKLGQMISTRADLFPAPFVAELAKLQDAAPPVPYPEIRRVIVEDLGAPPEERFAAFDPIPLASASIGQVHAARLDDGSEVVVKVRRPGVVEQVELDLRILARIVDWVQSHTAIGRDYDLRSLADEFAYTIRNELDYVREGQNADRLARSFAGDAGVRIPRVHWPLTTRRVLTLERMTGVKISDLATLDRLGISRRHIAENAVRIFLREVLEFGVFHADPHPGNFFVQPDGAIAIVDFGMVGRVSDTLRQHLLRAGLAAMSLDAEALADELYAIGVAGRRADRVAFQHDLDHLIGRYGGFSIAELSATEVTSELIGVAQRHRLQLPADLALLLRVVNMGEGLGLSLDPGFRYLEFASPLIRARWKALNSPLAGVRRLQRVVLDAAELGLELPRRTGRLLGRLERGELELNVQHEGLERFSHDLQRMTNRLALAIVLAASVVALGLALGVQTRPEVSAYLDWLFRFGFAFTLVFGAALLWSMRRGGGH